jgi:hypothetical protein
VGQSFLFRGLRWHPRRWTFLASLADSTYYSEKLKEKPKSIDVKGLNIVKGASKTGNIHATSSSK